jgi:hypothetical protein
MKLVNTTTEKSYPMQRVGPYTVPRGELRIEGKERSIEWHCNDLLATDAVLLGAPKVEVLEASKEARHLLTECLLFVLIDGESILESASLMCAEHPRLRPGKGNFWFVGSENDEPRGIFIVNGTYLEAVVRAPRTIPVIPRIWITIEAELYRGLSV